ncbi:binding-protein-dependent transporters inner membrane component [Halorubrum aidingense JCM 13560]|uniref:Binding-protein-dependent transporters inner membrane component n=1 Tax=Halorubrum aidingense JCM 13560 TaxID=1230454 RepID=M0PG80_9EURY|nr:ABC transporter permease [Halorubrum aidingense]EMA67795.1 binding-protein-dependent transporters inner membrane component [Halorubrum aidingense JCM 13560]
MATDTGGRFDGDGGTAIATGIGLDDPRRLVRGVAGIAGFVLLWHLVSLTQPAYVLPSPGAVVDAFAEELASGTMTAALWSSIRHWAPGTFVGTTLGVGAGVALSWSRLLDDVTAPLVRTLRPVPPLALIGFAIAWFGINDAGAAFIIAVGAFWINFYAAYGAVEGVSNDLLDVGRTLGVRGDLDMVRSIVVPAALPGITTGIRTGLGRCWMLVVASEIFGVPGVGREILRASNNLLVDKVIAYILVLSLMYLLVDVAFRAAQRRVLVWQA